MQGQIGLETFQRPLLGHLRAQDFLTCPFSPNTFTAPESLGCIHASLRDWTDCRLAYAAMLCRWATFVRPHGRGRIGCWPTGQPALLTAGSASPLRRLEAP